MYVIIALFFLLALGLFLPVGKFNTYKPLLISGWQLVLVAYFIQKLPGLANVKIFQTFNWIPEIGLNLSMGLDNLNIIFALLITGVGALVFLYAKSYMKSYANTNRFYFYLTVFSGAMLGLVLSYNMILLFIFWELTSFLSFFLISFFNEKETARKAAYQSLFITGFGGFSLLIGILLIGSIVGSYEITDWEQNAALITSHKLYVPALIFILMGVFTKSAQFPFHFWLPGAMQAPTPVSSYLHSATMVKAGVFLLMRLNPVLGGTFEWVNIISVIGAITFLTGAYFAIAETDIKGVLAYTTISALGLLVLLMGIDTRYSVKAALVFLLVHAFYKASLFMIAGIIDKKTGTRDITKLGQLFLKMPLLAVLTILALLSMAGLPPMLGFIGKELIYEAKVQTPGIAYMTLFISIASNVLIAAVSLFLIYRLFFSKYNYVKAPGKPDFLILTGPLVLVVLSLFLGIFPGKLNSIIQPALQLIKAEEFVVKLKLWHGFNNVLLLSLFTVFCAVILFYSLISYKHLHSKWGAFNKRVFRFRLADGFQQGLQGFIKLATFNTKKIQHGSHRLYLLTVIAITTLLLWFQLYVTSGWTIATDFTLKPFYMSGLVVIVVIAVLYSTVARSRMTTIIALGVAGYGLSVIYLYYSAVDLAITQIIVETLSLVMFFLILQRLPRFATLSSKKTRIRDALIALSFGGAMTFIALKAIHVSFNHPISDFFIANSYDKAYGKNIVNVILVDFRALDTFGEVMVLTIAALGVAVLLKSKKVKK